MSNSLKSVQRTYANRKQQDAAVGPESTSAVTNQKSPSTKMQCSSNLPQIFKKEQKDAKLRPNQYEIQLKTIFQHEVAPKTPFASAPQAQQQQQLYTSLQK